MPDDALKAAIKAEVARVLAQAGVTTRSTAVVDSVRDDGTLNLQWGDGILEAIPALDSYSPRAAGDVVQVDQFGGGLMQVVGHPGPGSSDGSSGGTTVTRGTGAPPGSGWTQAQSVWVRPGGVYAQLSAPPSQAEDAALSVPVAPADEGVYQSGHRTWAVNTGHATQGSAAGYPQNTGVVVYGNGITTACAGRTPTAMRLGLSRQDYRHGSWSAVRVQVYLIAASSLPASTPAFLDGPRLGPKLGLNSSGTYSVDADWQAQLASGAAGGFAFTADPGNGGYIQFKPSSGDLTIDFF